MQITDKVVIVTGASSGIGLATAKLLAEQWAIVVLAARSQEKLEHIAKDMPDALVVPMDMTNPEDVTRLLKTTVEKYGRIDMLLNVAGQGLHAPMEHTRLEEYRQIMELNVFAVMRIMQEVIPYMRKQGGGLILNVSSRVSKNYFPMMAAYASTKYALNAISLTARQELAKDHIVVCVMHPQITDTNFFKNWLGGASARTPSARPGAEMPKIDSPEAVAQKILEQIVSEEAEVEMQ